LAGLRGPPPRPGGGAAAGYDGPLSDAVATPIPFSMIGFDLGETGELEFRTSNDGRDWSHWEPARPLAAEGEGPDEGASEDGQVWRRMSAPVWVGEARWLQVRGADPRRVDARLIDSAGLSRSSLARLQDRALAALTSPGGVAHAAAPRPQIITRAQWGANESWSGTPTYASAARFAVVHHTAGTNPARQSDVPAIIRGIYRYHTQALGWKDIGYNFLVDPWGRVFEGRRGGVDRAVIGAHAAGYNTGSIGVSAIGCFDSNACGNSAAVRRSMLDGIDRILAWKFDIHDIDPYGSVTANSRRLPTIVGHRDVGSTACPGNRLFTFVRGTEDMRDRVAQRIIGFVDVPPRSTFVRDIVWLASAGITRGCNPPANDRFCPKDRVTREQMAAFLHRALG
jgi:hypothetical protein